MKGKIHGNERKMEGNERNMNEWKEKYTEMTGK